MIKSKTTSITATVATAVAVAAVVALEPAQAQAESCQPETTTAAKQKAREFIEQGFAHQQELQFEEAAAAYSQALRHWDHPEIRLALSSVLFNTSKLLDAYEHASRAVRCAHALENDAERQRAVALLQRLRLQLGEIVVYAPDSDMTILFNGVPWFDGSQAREQRKVVYPGPYVIAARQPGYVSVSESLDIGRNQRAVIAPRLVSEADATTVTRRWDPWIPWTVVGSSAAVAVAGTILRVSAASRFSNFDTQWDDRCTETVGDFGCDQRLHSDLIGQLDRARWESRISAGALITSGITMLVGITMLQLNRPRMSSSGKTGDATPTIVPLVTSSSTGAAMRGQF